MRLSSKKYLKPFYKINHLRGAAEVDVYPVPGTTTLDDRATKINGGVEKIPISKPELDLSRISFVNHSLTTTSTLGRGQQCNIIS